MDDHDVVRFGKQEEEVRTGNGSGEYLLYFYTFYNMENSGEKRVTILGICRE